MKIIFTGIPAFSERVQALSLRLAQAGHAVTVMGGKKELPAGIRNFHGVLLKRVPDWRTLLTLWRAAPGAVHLHGWQMAKWLPAFRFFLPETILVWTIDEAWGARPAGRRAGRRVRRAEAVCDSVTVTTRMLQWQLLTELGLRAAYIPDGFEPASAPLPALRRMGLWRGRYAAVCADTPREVAWAAEAHRQTGSRKKLVVIGDLAKEAEALATTFPFLVFLGTIGGRVQAAVFEGSAVILTLGASLPGETLLLAMQAGRPIIALAHPRFEEVYGVTARYVSADDGRELLTLLSSREKPRQEKSRRRAYTFFRWERIFAEYLPLYSQLRQVVPIDSIQDVRITQASVQ